MFTIYSFIRKFFKALVSENAPWQVGLGVLFGSLLGFLPFFSLEYEFIIAWPAAYPPCRAVNQRALGFGFIIRRVSWNNPPALLPTRRDNWQWS